VSIPNRGRPRPAAGLALGPWREPVEAMVIGLLIHGLMALTLVVAYRAYLAGLTALTRGRGGAIGWLVAPGEAAVGLLLGLAIGGWLAGLWLGERLPRGWPWPTLATGLLALPATLLLLATVTAEAPPARFMLAGLPAGSLTPLGPAVTWLGLLLGGLLGAWWAGLGPVASPAEAERPRG
jgi:MFS family permease